LQERLDVLTASKSTPIKGVKPTVETHKSSVAHDIKNSYIQNLHMKSSMFMLWIISGILGYAHKIPFIGKIITLLSFWYGRTTIWKILVKVRKGFVAFNALIGVYMVYKSIGFGPDNILAGFVGMGHTYLEVFINFNKRLFNWIFDIFDYKVVPNVPNTPPTSPPSWWPTSHPSPKAGQWAEDILNNPSFSLREIYTKGGVNLNINTTPWYRDLTTWMWIAGAASAIGVIYCGYQFLTNPLFLNDWFSPRVTRIDPNIRPNSPINPPVTNIIPPTDSNIVEGGISKSIVTFLSAGYSKLNPFNWFTAPTSGAIEARYENFLAKQFELNTYDERFYPHTNINPFAPWHQRLKMLLLGENVAEYQQRMLDKDYALRDYIAIQIKDTKIDGSFTPNVPTTPVGGGMTPVKWWPSSSPNVGHVGVGVKGVSGSGITEVIQASTSHNTLANKLASLPSTPNVLPTGSNPSWVEHAVDKAELAEYFDNTKGKQPWIVHNDNPFSALTEENI
jgi:hypothetical protein